MPSEVGGDVYVYNNAQLASLTMPSEVGGDVYVYNNAQLASYEIPEKMIKLNHHESIKDLISAKLLMRGILFADGIMAHVISSKNNVYKIRIFGKKEISYCVYRNGNFSHGKTVKEAIESLRYKASIRDTSEFKSWKKKEVRNIEELISAYRSITGACEQGVKMFCESLKLEDKYSIEVVIELTKGKYGHEQFKNFRLQS